MIHRISSCLLKRMLGLFLFSSPLLMSGQNSIEGFILSSDDKLPVVGALIRLDSTFLSTSSDMNGHFSFSGLKKPSYQAKISHLSFVQQNILLSPGRNDYSISLSPKFYLADEINITATRVDFKNGSAFTNISREELQSKNLGQDIPYLINNQPSIVVTSDAGNGIGYSGIRLRGNDATRLNVTINGIPVNDAESHQVYWVDLPDLASSIDNIQLQRGLGSSTNGSGAFGGSLNIQTKHFSPTPYGEINSSAGSFNSLKNTVSFGTGLFHNLFSIDGRLSAISSDGYIDRASSDLKSLYLSAGMYQTKQSIRFIMISGKEKTYQAWNGIPQEILDTNRTFNLSGQYFDQNGKEYFYNNQTDNYQQDYYQLLYSRVLTSNVNANIALHYTHGKGYYEEFKNEATPGSYNLEPIIIGDSTISAFNLIRRKWLDNDFYGFTFSFNYENKKWAVNIGGAANRYNGLHYHEIIAAEILPATTFPYEYFRDTANKNDANIFLRANYSVTERIDITVDLQERIVSYSFDGLNPDFTEGRQKISLNFFNPKISVNYRPNSLQRIYGYAGMGHKEPVRDDYLAATSAHRPEVESMNDFEAGYEFRNEKLSLSVNLYHMDYASQLVLTGKINDVGEYIRESVKNSSRSGIETQVGYTLSKKIDAKVNFTFSKNRIENYVEYVDKDDWTQVANTYKNTEIAFSPSLISGGELSYHISKNLIFQFNEKYVGKQYLDNTSASTRQLEAYFLGGLTGKWTIPVKGLQRLEVTMMINNIFDQKYIPSGYTFSYYEGSTRSDYNYYFPQAGRNWMAGIKVVF